MNKPKWKYKQVKAHKTSVSRNTSIKQCLIQYQTQNSKCNLTSDSKSEHSPFPFLQICQEIMRSLYRTTILGGILKYWLQTEPGFQDPLAMHFIVNNSSNSVSKHYNPRGNILFQYKQTNKLVFPCEFSWYWAAKVTLFLLPSNEIQNSMLPI